MHIVARLYPLFTWLLATNLLGILQITTLVLSSPMAKAASVGNETNSKCNAQAFTSILQSTNVTILNVTFFPFNSSYQNPYGLVFTKITSNLPAFCSVYGNVTTSSKSSFLFLVWLPDKTWNSRFLMVGNGGFGGDLNYPDCGSGIRRGFACATTNTGHNSTIPDGSWAYNNSETLIDWGYRAMHGTVVLAKQIIQAYYAPIPMTTSYYQGCSTGGRQGLKEIQDFPEDFNGALIGAPAWWNTHQQPWSLKIALHFLPNNSAAFIASSRFSAIHTEVMKQCDEQDGLLDGIISEPFGCDFNWNALLCSKANMESTDCFKHEQVDALYKLYTDYFDTNQTYVFTHMPLGSELGWPKLLGRNEPDGLGLDYVRYFLLNDPAWDYTNYDYSIIQLADKLRPGNANADNFNLRPFFNRGGKLIHYHGLADGAIPPGSSQYYYDHVYRNFSDTNLNDYYRFFYIPGMDHCHASLGNAPWVIGGHSQDTSLGSEYFGVPGYNDSKHDALLALVQWVEGGLAPEKIIATKYVNEDPKQGVSRQRPLCPYPQKARYVGHGNINDPANFECFVKSKMNYLQLPCIYLFIYLSIIYQFSYFLA